MDDTDLIPEIFFQFMEQAEQLEQLDEEVLNEYYKTLNDATNFLPELVSVIGPDAFMLLVKHFGGRQIRIPTAADVLSDVRKHGS